NTRIIRGLWNEVPAGVTVSIFFKVKVGNDIKDGEIVNIASAKLEEDNKVKEIIFQPIRSNETVNTVNNDYAIIGTVIDKETGLPKENAIVDVYDEDGNKVGTEITGKTGKFRIPVDSAGTYKVIYSDEKGMVITQKQAIVTLPGDNPAPIEISGKVVNSQTNEPIPNSQMALLDKDGNVVVTIKTDEKGKYNFSLDALGKPLAPGKYTVRVTKANGQVSYAKVNVSVSAGDIILNLDLLVDPFGFVYDLLGGKDIRIKGAEVRLISNCGDPNSLLSLDELEKGVPQKNPQITEENGNYQYFLNEEQRTNKTYCLKVTADSYEDILVLVRVYPSQKLPGRYEITIMDEKG
ncbi:MAG: collagen binding domain-containing protein, partial [Candidatus Sericytochromatia bacterium]